MADAKLNAKNTITLAAGDKLAVIDVSDVGVDANGAVKLVVATQRLVDLIALGATDGAFVVGDGTNLVLESGATARTSLGVGTGNTPQFTGIELGHATDTTLARVSAGVASIEGNTIAMLTATQTLTNKTLTDPTITGALVEDVYDHGTPGATPALNPTNGSIQTMTLSANATPTDSFTTGQGMVLLVADGASAYTVTWTSVVDQWVGGSAPTLPTTGYAVIALWCTVTGTVYANAIGDLS